MNRNKDKVKKFNDMLKNTYYFVEYSSENSQYLIHYVKKDLFASATNYNKWHYYSQGDYAHIENFIKEELPAKEEYFKMGIRPNDECYFKVVEKESYE